MKNLLNKLKVYGDLLPIKEFDVVAIHPLADETELLQKLHISPDESIYTGLYWAFNKELIFLDLWCSNTEVSHAKYYVKPNEKNGKSFYVLTNICPLTTQVVQNVLQNLREWSIENNATFNEITGKSNPVEVGSSDLGIIPVS